MPKTKFCLKGDREAALFLGCHILTIKKLRKLNKIPGIRIGRCFFYDPEELIKAFHIPTMGGQR